MNTVSHLIFIPFLMSVNFTCKCFIWNCHFSGCPSLLLKCIGAKTAWDADLKNALKQFAANETYDFIEVHQAYTYLDKKLISNAFSEWCDLYRSLTRSRVSASVSLESH